MYRSGRTKTKSLIQVSRNHASHNLRILPYALALSLLSNDKVPASAKPAPTTALATHWPPSRPVPLRVLP